MKRLCACIVVLIAVAFYLSSCEKDDLCADGTLTTPSLVIEFYNSSNRTQPKDVTNLKYFAEGRIDTLRPGTVSKIRVPLKTDMLSTKWGFIYNEVLTSGVRPNLDYLEFKYVVNQEYVSRACGYRATFTLDPDTDANPNPLPSIGTLNLWIDDIEVMTTNIVDEFETVEEDENDVHIKIYF
ncbi:MAG: DUF6452 family protein [Bacteroidota bacterium]